ncbi:MAG: cytochrome P450, partial [Acidimicrobiia bacterium]
MAQIDHLLAQTPPVDLYTSFTLPIPWNTINELLGIPSLDQKVIAGYTKILHSSTTTSEQMAATLKEFYAFCEELSKHGKATHDDSFLSQVQNGLRAGRISQAEASMGILNLIVAGHVTTASVMALAALMLLLNPEQFHALREEPEVVRNAVEELLRFDSITNFGLPRVAAEDVLVGETLISAGDGVIVSVASANRDATVFDDPYKLDIRREGARRHMTFGHGAHKCLGQWLAKAQLQIALPALATR